MNARCKFFAALAALALGASPLERPSSSAAAAEAAADEAELDDRGFWRGWRLPLAQDDAPGDVAEPAPPIRKAVEVPAEVGTEEEELRLLLRAVGLELFSPAYAAFEEEAGELADAASGYCDDAGETSALRRAWRRAMTAWQRAQHFRAGPIAEDNRRLRIQWFPTRSNEVQRGIQRWLSSSEAITQEAIAMSSVSVQGLPALERLIFSEEGLMPGERRCALAAAIAKNVQVMAREVAQPWREDGGAALAGFVAGEAPFLGLEDALVGLFESIVVQAEFIADQKIARALRLNDSSVLASPLAKHSKQNLAANLAAFERLVSVEGFYRLSDYLRRVHEAHAAADALASKIEQLQADLGAIAGALEDIVADDAGEPLDRLRVGLRELRSLGEDAAIAAGVTIRFNSEDGD